MRYLKIFEDFDSHLYYQSLDDFIYLKNFGKDYNINLLDSNITMKKVDDYYKQTIFEYPDQKLKICYHTVEIPTTPEKGSIASEGSLSIKSPDNDTRIYFNEADKLYDELMKWYTYEKDPDVTI